MSSATKDILGSLSPRELEVVTLALEGLDTSQIAVSLGISASSVRVVLHRSYAKLDVSNLQELRQAFCGDGNSSAHEGQSHSDGLISIEVLSYIIRFAYLSGCILLSFLYFPSWGLERSKVIQFGQLFGACIACLSIITLAKIRFKSNYSAVKHGSFVHVMLGLILSSLVFICGFVLGKNLFQEYLSSPFLSFLLIAFSLFVLTISILIIKLLISYDIHYYRNNSDIYIEFLTFALVYILCSQFANPRVVCWSFSFIFAASLFLSFLLHPMVELKDSLKSRKTACSHLLIQSPNSITLISKVKLSAIFLVFQLTACQFSSNMGLLDSILRWSFLSAALCIVLSYLPVTLKHVKQIILAFTVDLILELFGCNLSLAYFILFLVMIYSICSVDKQSFSVHEYLKVVSFALFYSLGLLLFNEIIYSLTFNNNIRYDTKLIFDIILTLLYISPTLIFLILSRQTVRTVFEIAPGNLNTVVNDLSIDKIKIESLCFAQGLSSLQTHVVLACFEGKTIKQTALDLNYSESAVKLARRKACMTFGVLNTKELVSKISRGFSL